MINAKQYIPLAHKIAGIYYRRYKRRYEYEDILHIGYIGLMKAVNNFDETRGVKFITYAYSVIKGEILRYIRDDKWYTAKNRKERLYNGIAPISLDIRIGEKKNTSLMDRLIDRTVDNASLKFALESIPEELSKIIKLKYFNGFNQTEIARMLNTNQVRISRKETEALKLLKEEITTKEDVI